jgi:arylsulfatase
MLSKIKRCGKCGQDKPLSEFNKSIVQFPNKARFPGGASNDNIPNLYNPANPLPYDPIKVPKTIGGH